MIDWLVDNRYLFGFNQTREKKHVRKQRRKRKKQKSFYIHLVPTTLKKNVFQTGIYFLSDALLRWKKYPSHRKQND